MNVLVTPRRRLASFASRLSIVVLALGTYVVADPGQSNVLHAQAQAPDPQVVGQWSASLPWPIEAVHTHLLPTGKVMFYGFVDDSRLWDPTTGAFSPVALAGFNIFCTGHSFLPDGRLFLAGGHITNSVGLPNSAAYDPFTNTWTPYPDMNAGRWYPTNTNLPNGDVLVVSGDIDTTQRNPLPQVWELATGTWRDLTTAQLVLPLYPFMFLLGDGRVFMAGPGENARFLDTSGTGAWSAPIVSAGGLRDYGSAVMYDEGKVLIVGGNDPPTETAEVIDLNVATPAWRTVAPMANKRRQNTATLLPDGTVLITGGSSGAGFDNAQTPVLDAELWDPLTETFTTLPPIWQYRGYHSVALLLPDGRVLSTAGDTAGESAEIYSPAYLFKGPRPTVTSAPTSIAYTQAFAVATPDAERVVAVNLLRLGSVTHALNMDQRINRLPFTVTGTGLSVTAPSTTALAPAGYYMMFLIDAAGVPSVASFVRLTDGALDPVGPVAPVFTVSAPIDGAPVSGVTTFKASMSGMELSAYSVFWQIAGDRLNPMADGTDGVPHKAAEIDLTDWTWLGTGPYPLNFVAKNAAGETIAEQAVNIFVEDAPPVDPGQPALIVTAPTEGAPLSGVTMFRASMEGMDLTAYSVSWQIAGDRLNPMADSTEGGAHKAAAIDLTGWTWLGTGPYPLNFVARNAAGETVAEQAVSIYVTTAVPGPTNLTATVGTANNIVLTWTDNVPNDLRFEIERCVAPCTIFTAIAQVGANVVTYNNTGLTGGTAYNYRVRAAITDGNTAYSNVAGAATPAGPGQPVLTVTAPTEGAQLSGVTTFRASIEGMAPGDYSVSWQIAGDRLNPMEDNTDGGVPHKSALVDLSGWTWLGTGPYPLNFVAKNAAGETVAQKAVNIHVVAAPPAGPTPSKTKGTK